MAFPRVWELKSADTPVVLLSAGIGATPVLAMLHALSAAASPGEVWWIYGARNRAAHPFAKKSRGLLQTLINGRSHIVYSKPIQRMNPVWITIRSDTWTRHCLTGSL